MESSAAASSLPKLSRNPGDRKYWRLWASYATDWLLTFVLAGIFFGLNSLAGFRRNFSLNDETIQLPYTEHERVPPWLLIIYAFILPLVFMPIVNVVSVRSLWDLHNSTLGLILSLTLTGSLTNILKLTAGRPRPDLIARCLPRPGSHNHPIYGLVDYTVCTQTDDDIMRDGWKSFLSGHASLSFAGLGFLSFYLAGKMHLFDHRGQTAKAWLSLLPLLGATVIAITRTMDYRHHWEDITVGLSVGIVTAYFSYRQYYPSLDHALSHFPYAPRHYPNNFQVTGHQQTEDGGIRRKGKGRDLEAGNTSSMEAENDLIDLGYEPEGTVPRNRVPDLKRVWTETSERRTTHGE